MSTPRNTTLSCLRMSNRRQPLTLLNDFYSCYKVFCGLEIDNISPVSDIYSLNGMVNCEREPLYAQKNTQ
ncbi:hypothetical protein DFO55_102438 [Grimontella sp. AG753]|nr:hypothetical protein DFO55_102438 [Grimontella sp. AG753]